MARFLARASVQFSVEVSSKHQAQFQFSKELSTVVPIALFMT